ncbi:hypothetical protein [Sphingomonas sp. Leaf4]|uniref:hypothetical protein n=1 Tax=Sphingomonas sp. Leaf4 TaxID=2876553 RepID=UPI001E5DBEA8|nr:hypothetical protein [Sphingomonas sp. Leaf4]
MIALALFALAQPGSAVPPAPAAPVETPVVPRTIDWAALPPLPYRHVPRPTPRMTRFVATELRRTACPMPVAVGGRVQVQVDVAVLIGVDGLVRATIPRAIDCPTVEQYAAGLVVSFARGNLVPRLVSEGAWYRASLAFDWAA